MGWCRALPVLLLVACGSAAAPGSVSPAPRERAFDTGAFITSGGPASPRECERARAAAGSELDAARIERRCGDLDAARAHYRRALDAGAGCEVALELSAIVEDEAPLLARFVSEAPFTADTLDEVGRQGPHTCRPAALRLAELRRGARDDAPLRILAPLLAADPSDPDALAELALHHLARNQLGAAAQVCARIGEHAGGLFACGLLALKRGELHDAERRLRAALALDPDGPAAPALADHLMSTRRYAEALVLYHRLHERAPRDYEALLNLGVAFTYTGCVDAARRAYQRATELAPERVEAWYDLGLLYRYDGTHAHYVEYALALDHVLNLAQDRPELASLARSIRDEECIRRARESRGAERRRRPACGHLPRLYRSTDMELREMQTMVVRGSGWTSWRTHPSNATPDSAVHQAARALCERSSLVDGSATRPVAGSSSVSISETHRAR